MVKLSPRKNPHPKKVLPLIWSESDEDGETAEKKEDLPEGNGDRIKGTVGDKTSSDVIKSNEEDVAGPVGVDKEQHITKLTNKSENNVTVVNSAELKADDEVTPPKQDCSTVWKTPQKKKTIKAGVTKTPKKIIKRTPKKTARQTAKSVKASDLQNVRNDCVIKIDNNLKVRNYKGSNKLKGQQNVLPFKELQSVSDTLSNANGKVSVNETVVEKDCCARLIPNIEWKMAKSSGGDKDDPDVNNEDLFKGRTTDEIIVAESMLLINTRELTETLSALNKDSVALSTPLHNSATEKRINSFRTPSKTPIKRTTREFLTPDRLTERSIRSASVAGRTPSRIPIVCTPLKTPTHSSPKSIMKDRRNTDDKTPSPKLCNQKSPRVQFANLPAKHTNTSIPRTQKLREVEKIDAESPGKRKRGPEEQSAKKKKVPTATLR